MSKIIIGIHGLGNKPSKELLENWWRKAICEGLNGIGKESVNPKFKMIYWADILYRKPLDETNIDEKYTVGIKKTETNPAVIRRKLLDLLEKGTDKIFLNEDLSLNYPFLFDSYINRNFKDLSVYYSDKIVEADKHNRTFKEIVRNRVIEIFKKHRNDEIFLVGHSMGSIIAYDALTFLSKDIKIDTFVTIGSPLGQPYVVSKTASELNAHSIKIKKLKTPPGIERCWYNFSDLEDKVAINYHLADDYDENSNGVKVTDVEVYNNYECNGERNPHKSFGYLRTPEFSKVLYEFLISGRSKPSMWLFETVNKFYNFFKARSR